MGDHVHLLVGLKTTHDIPALIRIRGVPSAPRDRTREVNTVLEFLPEASAEIQCITGDYEAKVEA